MRMKKEIRQQIGLRVRMIREFFGITQELFSTKFGINRGLLSKYEKGDLGVPDSLKAIFFEMGISLDWLITGEGQMFRTPDNKPSFQIDKVSSSKASFSEDLKTLVAETRAIRMLNKEILDTIRTQGGSRE